MFQTFRTLLATAVLSASVAFAMTAQAAPVVQVGSTFDLSITGQVSGGTYVSGVVFDGVAQNFTRTMTNGVTLNMSVNESQQDLGNGQYRILIDITADGDIYPYQGPIGQLPNDRESGFLGVGAGNDPLNLLGLVKLESAVIHLFNGAQQQVGQGDFISFITQKQPWNGTFPDPGFIAGFGNAGNFGIQGVQLDLVVSNVNNVPEPGALALVGLGLLGLVAARRRA